MTWEERERAVFLYPDDEVRKLSTSELKYVCKHYLLKITYKAPKKVYVSPVKVKRWEEGIGKKPVFEKLRPVLNRKGMAEEIIKRRSEFTEEQKINYLTYPTVVRKVSLDLLKEAGVPYWTLPKELIEAAKKNNKPKREDPAI